MEYDLKDNILNSELDRIDNLIKEEKYDDAHNLLDLLEKNYGPSGKLFLKKAKYHTCLLKFPEAIKDYQEANKSYIMQIGNGEDPICTYHLPIVKKLMYGKMTQSQFIAYVKKLTKNDNYTIPDSITYTFKSEIKEKITLKRVASAIFVFLVMLAALALFLYNPLFFIWTSLL